MFGFLKEYTVYLKNDSNIFFPDKCIVCGESCANEKIEVEGYYEKSTTWSLFPLIKYFPQKFKILVPLHNNCNEIVKKKESIRSAILIGIFLLLLSLLAFIENQIDEWTLVRAVIAVIIMHYFLNMFWFPTPFDFSKSELRTKFKFGSKIYADEFKKINKSILFDIGQLFQSK